MARVRIWLLAASAIGLALLGLLGLTTCAPLPWSDRMMTNPVAFVPPGPRRLAGTSLSLSGEAPRASRIAAPADLAARVRAADPAVRPLVPFFEALAALESGASAGPMMAGPVVIVQIGDSHTANDRMSGRLRELFQERFGAAGRGMLPPGIPFKYYRPAHVAVAVSDGWTLASSFSDKASGLFGVAGFRFTGVGAGETMTLEATDPPGFDWLAVEVVMQPGGGTLDIKVDGAPAYRLATARDTVQGGWLNLPVPPGSRKVQIETRGDGRVDLLSWTVERDRKGVVYENLGIIGAAVGIVGRWDPAIVAWELAQRAPSLIVVAYGTNEGFHDPLTRERYAVDVERRLKQIRAAAPQASIVVMGPPDANRFPAGCPPARKQQALKLCKPLSGAEREDYAARFQARLAPDSCRWHTPPNLAMVRQVQRSAAAAQGLYFWDWSQVMGGECGMHDWVMRDPPLAMDDHVHLRAPGYQITAEALFQELMDHYGRYRRQVRGGPAQEPGIAHP